MTKKKSKLPVLFASTFKISACTFGGGFVIIPLMKKKFVEQLHWIDEKEMLDMVAIAQSSPGPIAVNASILVGYHTAGIGGALLCALGTILPPLIIISTISLFYQAFRDNKIVGMLMMGMTAGVAAVILDVVFNMARNIVKKKRLLPVLVLIASFIAVWLFKINIIIILLICSLIGVADNLLKDRQPKGGTAS